MMRSPKSGRAWEESGEDPYLAGVMSAETVKGVQNNDVIATAKHFILDEQGLNKFTSSSEVDSKPCMKFIFGHLHVLLKLVLALLCALIAWPMALKL